MLASTRLPWPIDAGLLRADVHALAPDAWVPHFNTAGYDGEWSGVALRSIGGQIGRLYPDPTLSTAFADTPLMVHCPGVQAVLAHLRCPLLAVRFLRLGPGSRIREHSDLNLGFEDGEVRIHIPVATDPTVEFRLDGQRVEMAEGEAWYLNLNLPRQAASNSPRDRLRGRRVAGRATHLSQPAPVDAGRRDSAPPPGVHYRRKRRRVLECCTCVLVDPPDKMLGHEAGMEADERLISEAVALAGRLLVDGQRRSSRGQRRQAERLARLIEDPAGLALSLALTDEVIRIDEPARAARRFVDVVRRIGVPSSLGVLDRALMRAGVAAAPLLPGPAGSLLHRRVRREARHVVKAGEDPDLAAHLARRRAQGIVPNVNVLGEAVLGEEEAGRRLEAVLRQVRRADVTYVSVKVSALCSQLGGLAFDAEVARVAARLRPLYEAARSQSPPVLVNLDMEEHRDLELTLTAFQRVLEEPSFVDLIAGVVLQAYLPDSHGAAARHSRGHRPGAHAASQHG